MEKKEKTAEEILYNHVGMANSYWCDPVLKAMNEFADQRYSPSEVMAIMEKVREKCADEATVKGDAGYDNGVLYNAEVDKGSILEIDLTKYLNK